MTTITSHSRLRQFEAEVLRCHDVEALQELAIRLFAENQGRSLLYEDLLQGLRLSQ